MVDYQPRHASHNIHCTTARPHHSRREGAVATSDALAFARHALADAYERLKTAGIGQQELDTAFGAVFAALGESPGSPAPPPCPPEPDQRTHNAACQEQEAARPEPDELAGGQPGPVIRPPIPDLPGVSLRPDPVGAGTVTGFLECLRNYRLWAGNPSFRVMSRNCERRYAPSTLCTALGGDSLPTLEMTLAIVAACGGPQEHQCEFATAWRRLVIPRQEPGKTAS